MTKDVLITLSGFRFGEGGKEEIEVITAGDYFRKNGSHYILYQEILEDGDVIKNTIKIRPGFLDIIKRGSLHTHMAFEKDKKSMSRYATPFGEMMIGISTDDIAMEEGEDSLKVQVEYSLDIDYQHVSKCSITLDIQSRSTADIHLNP